MTEPASLIGAKTKDMPHRALRDHQDEYPCSPAFG